MRSLTPRPILRRRRCASEMGGDRSISFIEDLKRRLDDWKYENEQLQRKVAHVTDEEERLGRLNVELTNEISEWKDKCVRQGRSMRDLEAMEKELCAYMSYNVIGSAKS